MENKEKEYFEFLMQEYLSQKENYSKIIYQMLFQMIIIIGIIVFIIFNLIQGKIYLIIEFIITLTIILKILFDKYSSRNIEEYDCFNIGTFEETIKFNREEYNRKSEKIDNYLKIYLLISFFIVVLSII